MVIVKIVGGLGNQLFQYAAARRLSILHQTELKLDISAFEHYAWHAYSLRPFCIQEVFATPEEIQKVKGTSRKGISRIVSSLNQRYNPYFRSPVFEEADFGPFDPRISRTPRDIYLSGYWQSEKYFADIQDVIRREFAIRYEQDDQSQELAQMIANTQSVSLHVRRGNYVSISQINSKHGTCSIEYYQECVKRIGQKLNSPHLFVFSDDPSWVKANLRLEYPTTYVVHNDASRDYEDLRLMSMCQHQIIANSTFSWWGAWLNPNPGKIVLAPKRWFVDSTIDTRDLFPNDWIRI